MPSRPRALIGPSGSSLRTVPDVIVGEARVTVHRVPVDAAHEGSSLRFSLELVPPLWRVQAEARASLEALFGSPLECRAARGALGVPRIVAASAGAPVYEAPLERVDELAAVGVAMVALHAVGLAVGLGAAVHVASLHASEEWVAIRDRYPPTVHDICGLPGTYDAFASCREIIAGEVTQAIGLGVAAAAGVAALIAFWAHGASSRAPSTTLSFELSPERVGLTVRGAL